MEDEDEAPVLKPAILDEEPPAEKRTPDTPMPEEPVEVLVDEAPVPQPPPAPEAPEELPYAGMPPFMRQILIEQEGGS